jgi:hypothetical protein
VFDSFIKLVPLVNLVTTKKVDNRITLDECKQFHPQQWVKLYGLDANRHDYIITCQVYQLEIVLSWSQRHWWDNYILEPVDEKEQPISIEEALLKCQHLQ